jgi:hypothetical protein
VEVEGQHQFHGLQQHLQLGFGLVANLADPAAATSIFAVDQPERLAM